MLLRKTYSGAINVRDNETLSPSKIWSRDNSYPPTTGMNLSCFEGHTDAHADHSTLKNIIQ